MATSQHGAFFPVGVESPCISIDSSEDIQRGKSYEANAK